MRAIVKRTDTLRRFRCISMETHFLKYLFLVRFRYCYYYEESCIQLAANIESLFGYLFFPILFHFLSIFIFMYECMLCIYLRVCSTFFFAQLNCWVMFYVLALWLLQCEGGSIWQRCQGTAGLNLTYRRVAAIRHNVTQKNLNNSHSFHLTQLKRIWLIFNQSK